MRAIMSGAWWHSRLRHMTLTTWVIGNKGFFERITIKKLMNKEQGQ
jgi:hypothetical protein